MSPSVIDIPEIKVSGVRVERVTNSFGVSEMPLAHDCPGGLLRRTMTVRVDYWCEVREVTGNRVVRRRFRQLTDNRCGFDDINMALVGNEHKYVIASVSNEIIG